MEVCLPNEEKKYFDLSNRESISEWFSSLATLSQCTDGGRCYDNEDHGFCLEIPVGAIPKGESITIDIGVALYGPFQYPEGLRPVSPVFWVCVRDQKDFQFLKPVKVSIPHCLSIENCEDIESLTILKGDHVHQQMKRDYQIKFQQAEGDAYFEPYKKHGTFQTTHFCSLCICSKFTKQFIQKAVFCISAVIPSEISATATAYFFVTFLLQTCLSTVKDQISKDPAIQGYTQVEEEFRFRYKNKLEIIPPKLLPDSWKIGLAFGKKVCYKFCNFH